MGDEKEETGDVNVNDKECFDKDNEILLDVKHINGESLSGRAASQVLTNYSSSAQESIKYPCQQCDYQATRSYNLQLHIKSKHEGIKYPCQHCDYQATQSVNLQRHIKVKHLF